MKKAALSLAPCIVFLLLFGYGYSSAQDLPADAMLKLQNGKLPPVAFSHSTHVDKYKIECVACHHQDPVKPKACTTCHTSETQGKTLSAKDAFHGKCVTCHKEQAAKAPKVPTKCNDCHKR